VPRPGVFHPILPSQAGWAGWAGWQAVCSVRERRICLDLLGVSCQPHAAAWRGYFGESLLSFSKPELLVLATSPRTVIGLFHRSAVLSYRIPLRAVL